MCYNLISNFNQIILIFVAVFKTGVANCIVIWNDELGHLLLFIDGEMFENYIQSQLFIILGFNTVWTWKMFLLRVVFNISLMFMKIAGMLQFLHDEHSVSQIIFHFMKTNYLFLSF